MDKNNYFFNDNRAPQRAPDSPVDNPQQTFQSIMRRIPPNVISLQNLTPFPSFFSSVTTRLLPPNIYEQRLPGSNNMLRRTPVVPHVHQQQEQLQQLLSSTASSLVGIGAPPTPQSPIVYTIPSDSEEDDEDDAGGNHHDNHQNNNEQQQVHRSTLEDVFGANEEVEERVVTEEKNEGNGVRFWSEITFGGILLMIL